ncbi:MAG: EamA family transporter [Thermomicrobiales bacterium]|nr:EamA family transporter [Thermomicrobiales bacterium]
MGWFSYAVLSALAAAATAVLAKIGIKDVNSNLATAIRTGVVLVFAWGIVFATGAHKGIPKLSNHTLLFLGLSGIATGLSWLFYFRALQIGKASQVAPVDKFSLVLTIVFAAAFLGESISWGVAAGVALIVAGTVLVALG